GKRTWSTAAPKEYSLDRAAFTGKIPFEVQEVHAIPSGFELKITKPLEKKAASDPANYLVNQFTYKYHSEHESPEFAQAGKIGATETPVEKIELIERGVRLQIGNLKEGFVTSFQLAITSDADEDLRNDTFYYTLNSMPRGQ